MHSYEEIIAKAKEILPRFLPIVEETPYEKHGMLYSEVLFLLACVELIGAKRVLESGTSRAQSTVLLARALPDKEIITIEYDINSPNVAIAEDRLRSYKNVTQVFGDSRIELPKRIGKDAVVVIDGPKMFLAIRLAIRLLATGKIAGVFIHDMDTGTPERDFLNIHFPEARFSDAVQYAKVVHSVDAKAIHALAPKQQLSGVEGKYGYGFSLAWIPHTKNRFYNWVLFYSYIYDAFSRPGQLVSRLRRKLKT